MLPTLPNVTYIIILTLPALPVLLASFTRPPTSVRPGIEATVLHTPNYYASVRMRKRGIR